MTVVYLWIPSEHVRCIQLVYFILGFMTKVAEKWSKSGRKVVEKWSNRLLQFKNFYILYIDGDVK